MAGRAETHGLVETPRGRVRFGGEQNQAVDAVPVCAVDCQKIHHIPAMTLLPAPGPRVDSAHLTDAAVYGVQRGDRDHSAAVELAPQVAGGYLCDEQVPALFSCPGSRNAGFDEILVVQSVPLIEVGGDEAPYFIGNPGRHRFRQREAIEDLPGFQRGRPAGFASEELPDRGRAPPLADRAPDGNVVGSGNVEDPGREIRSAPRLGKNGPPARHGEHPNHSAVFFDRAKISGIDRVCQARAVCSEVIQKEQGRFKVRLQERSHGCHGGVCDFADFDLCGCGQWPLVDECDLFLAES